MNKGWLADLRRKYHHVLQGGSLRPADLAHIVTNAEHAAARIDQLEGDLNLAHLQLKARMCSECPAKGRVEELEAMLRDRDQ